MPSRRFCCPGGELHDPRAAGGQGVQPRRGLTSTMGLWSWWRRGPVSSGQRLRLSSARSPADSRWAADLRSSHHVGQLEAIRATRRQLPKITRWHSGSSTTCHTVSSAPDQVTVIVSASASADPRSMITHTWADMREPTSPWDAIVRYLCFRGYRVRYVRHIIDVWKTLSTGEDRIVRAAKREASGPAELRLSLTRAVLKTTWMPCGFSDRRSLRALQGISLTPSSGSEIPVERGYGYGGWTVTFFFSVDAFPVSANSASTGSPGRYDGATDLPQRRNPADFPLWRKAGPGHAEASWPRGRWLPGGTAPLFGHGA